uniref:Uncharacterized protein n=1 Tax=Oryza sativa subsp. indica TaxID=39946 RepID=Q0P181_ORYSI|nr:hypothetical protein TQR13L11.4 [Oryza sativa Indica Group]
MVSYLLDVRAPSGARHEDDGTIPRDPSLSYRVPYPQQAAAGAPRWRSNCTMKPREEGPAEAQAKPSQSQPQPAPHKNRPSPRKATPKASKAKAQLHLGNGEPKKS